MACEANLKTGLIIFICISYHTHNSGAAAAVSLWRTHSASAGRSLKAWPLPLPFPFQLPHDVAESARQAHKAGNLDTYSSQMCALLADPNIQGSLMFSDPNVKLWPIFINIARAAYGYEQQVADVWGQVFAKCNSLGGMSARGVGNGLAFIYAKGVVEGSGATNILESSYQMAVKQFGNGCQAVDQILDITAAVTHAHSGGQDELYSVLPSYSKVLQQCTPKDSQQKFKAASIGPSRAAVRMTRRASKLPAPTATGD